MNILTETREAEKIFHETLQRIELDKVADYRITSVSISYHEVPSSSGKQVDFVFKRNGTMELFIADTSIDSGVKYALAKFIWEFKAKHIYAPHRRSTVPALLPIITFVPPLLLFGGIALGDLGLSLLLGPALYAVITLPGLLYLSKRKQEDHAGARNDLRAYLSKSGLYTTEEISYWVSWLTRRLALYHIVEYILFLPILAIFMWMVFVLNY